MGGRFQNTKYVNTVNNLTDAMTSLINNPYYIHTDKKPFISDYLNINKEMTTLDEGSKINYAYSGEDSPIRYNLIKDFILYGGGNRIDVTLNKDEFGLQADNIEGEFIILPNTITPYPGDMFKLKSIKNDYALFRVTNVSIDTLENGNNMYKITYQLESDEEYRYQEVRTRIVNTYHMIIDNIGTDYNIIMKDEVYDYASKLDDLSLKLKIYFKSLFYSTRVQTFIYKYSNDKPLYDFFMIEFLMRNHILDNDDNYIYICHQMRTPNKFPIVYNNSFFRCIELKDLAHIRRYTYKGTPMAIEDIRSIFFTRQEDYFYVCYDCYDVTKSIIPSFRDELIYNIENNIKYEDCKYKIFNIIIKYFNDEDLSQDDIEAFDCIGYDACIDLFYGLPVIIYCLEKYISKSISTNKSNDKKDFNLDPTCNYCSQNKPVCNNTQNI